MHMATSPGVRPQRFWKFSKKKSPNIFWKKIKKKHDNLPAMSCRLMTGLNSILSLNPTRTREHSMCGFNWFPKFFVFFPKNVVENHRTKRAYITTDTGQNATQFVLISSFVKITKSQNLENIIKSFMIFWKTTKSFCDFMIIIKNYDLVNVWGGGFRSPKR